MITLTTYRRSPPPLTTIGGKRREWSLSQNANGSRKFDPPEPSQVDTVGCNCFKIFATPGSQNSVQTYSRQYENGSTVTAFVYNPYPYNLTNGTIQLGADRPNWTLAGINGTSFDVLGPGESRPVAWNLRYDGPPSKYPPPNRYAGTVTYTGKMFPPYLS